MMTPLRFLPAALVLCLAAGSCGEAPRGGNKGTTTTAGAADMPAAGCYLGGETALGDSIMIRIGEAANAAAFSGAMSVVIHEKDRRSGSLQGAVGTDGIVRATYTFMQEGMSQSVQVQLRQPGGEGQRLQLRPPAYDPATGAEYPDSSRDFSIILSRVPCGEAGSTQQ